MNPDRNKRYDMRANLSVGDAQWSVIISLGIILGSERIDSVRGQIFQLLTSWLEQVADYPFVSIQRRCRNAIPSRKEKKRLNNKFQMDHPIFKVKPLGSNHSSIAVTWHLVWRRTSPDWRKAAVSRGVELSIFSPRRTIVQRLSNQLALCCRSTLLSPS